MHVRKFEARTMKEALEMVKTHLGPDAIILSARDNQKKYGLVGESSYEITAAVSEEVLQQKKFVESRLRPEDRERLNKSSAKTQKQVITQMVQKYTTEQEEKKIRPMTQTRYIEIDQPQSSISSHQQAGQSRPNQIHNPSKPGNHQAPVSEHRQTGQQKISQNLSSPVSQAAPIQQVQFSGPSQVQQLQGEIEQLKQVIAQFQKIPQSLVANSFPGSSLGLPYECSPTFEKLVEAGISEELSAQILEEAPQIMPAAKLKNKALVDGFAAKKILDDTLISSHTKAQIQCFVGPAGSGKTATLVKLASHMVVKENKKVAIITTDLLKVGSVDQMRIYSQILNVPFAVIKNKLEWPRLMSQLTEYDHILVDFSGVSLKTMEEISLIRQLLPPDNLEPNIHLVLNSLAKDSDLLEIGRRYQVSGYQDVIFTCVDESAQHGNIYNFMKTYNMPIHSFGIGSRVPEDFEMATKERLLDLIFKITRVNRQVSMHGVDI